MITHAILTFDRLMIVKHLHEESIEFRDGTRIEFSHDGDCCEHNFADISALENTGFEQERFAILDIERLDVGVRINGYFLPCYSHQNGYYSSDVDLTVIKNNKVLLFMKLESEVSDC